MVLQLYLTVIVGGVPLRSLKASICTYQCLKILSPVEMLGVQRLFGEARNDRMMCLLRGERVHDFGGMSSRQALSMNDGLSSCRGHICTI